MKTKQAILVAEVSLREHTDKAEIRQNADHTTVFAVASVIV